MSIYNTLKEFFNNLFKTKKHMFLELSKSINDENNRKNFVNNLRIMDNPKKQI